MIFWLLDISGKVGDGCCVRFSKLAFFLIALAAAGLGLAFALWDKAFPTAALDFKITRGEAEMRMAQWIESERHPLAGYRHAVAFGEEDSAKTYIELEAGLPAIEEFSRKGVMIWYWWGRWFKPEQEEEFQVNLDTRGNLTGYTHKIEEGRAAPLLSKEQARALAGEFLRKQVAHHPFAQLHFVEDSMDKKPRRTDYTFVWEQDDLRVKEARYRLQVTIQGNEVGEYSEYLKIPETWSRDFAKKQTVNELCYQLAGYANWPLDIAICFLFIAYMYQRRIKWRRALPWGWVALLFLVYLANSLNDIPMVIASYDTEKNWGSYILENIFTTAKQLAYATAYIWVLAFIVDPLYRKHLPQHLPFELGLGREGLRRDETLRSIAIGTAFACWSVGYVCLFYVVGRQHGVWVPVEIDYAKTLSGWMPWVQPMEVGLTAAFSEELIYRALAILLYTKIFRSRWVAIILSAVTWAFLHSNYPQMPGYTRGIELTIEGILWGWLMVRYGIVSTLVAHYLYDCWLGSLIVIQSPSWADRIGAVAVSFWPIALGVWGWWRYARRSEMLESRDPSKSSVTLSNNSGTRWWEAPSKAWNFTPVALSARTRLAVLAVSITVIAAVEFAPLPQDCMDRLGKLSKSRTEIAAAADSLLRERGKNPSDFHRITSLNVGGTEARYLLEHGDLKSVAELYDTELPDMTWWTRYFRFGEKEEYRFTLDKNGRLVSWNHLVPREGKGGSLEKDAALAIAKKELLENHGVHFDREKITQDNMTQQEHRRDYSFIFQREDWHRGESELRTSITVQGDEAIGFQRWVKVPEAWQREQSLSGWKDVMVGQLGWLLWIGKISIIVVLFILMIRLNILPWKTGFLVALVPSFLGLLDWLNGMPWFFSGYDTTKSASFFIGGQLGNLVAGTVLGYLVQVLLVSVTLGLMRWAFNWTWRDIVFWPSAIGARRRLWLDALALGLFSIAIWQVKGLGDAMASGWLFPWRVASYNFPAVNSALPWFASLSGMLSLGYNNLLDVALKVACLVVVYRRFPKLVWVVLLAEPVFSAMGEKTWGEFGLAATSGELQRLIGILLVWKIWRFNVPAILLAFTLQSLINSIEMYITKGGPSYQWQAAPLVIVMLLFAFFAFRPMMGSTSCR